jgi:hypothetical protein
MPCQEGSKGILYKGGHLALELSVSDSFSLSLGTGIGEILCARTVRPKE